VAASRGFCKKEGEDPGIEPIGKAGKGAYIAAGYENQPKRGYRKGPAPGEGRRGWGKGVTFDETVTYPLQKGR